MIAFSFHRIMVNVLLIMINILFTETEISSKNAEQAQYRVNRLLQAFSFFQVCLQFQIFYILKHLKLKLTEENQALVGFHFDVLSQLDSDQGINNNNNNFFCTQQYTEISARRTGCPK